MTNFLAIDFGTTNTLAAEITDDLKLNIVPLDKNTKETPSAIFLKKKSFKNRELNLDILEERVKRAISDQELVRQKAITHVRERLKNFWNTYCPRVREPGRTYSIFESRTFNFVKNSELEAAKELFRQTKYENEKLNLISNLPEVKTEEEIRLEIKSQLIEELVKHDIADLKEQTFFTALEDPEMEPLFGADAIDSYAGEPQSGFFMRSPKAFLGVPLTESQKELFIRIITLIIRNVKIKSESYLGKLFDGVVIGRPVNFMGANTDDLNDQAEDILRSAAIRAGFNLIRFVHEPLAASLTISNTFFSTDTPALIIDIGGGTTDVAFLRVDLDSHEKIRVAGISGQRVGGNDFDEKIAFNKFSRLLGVEYVETRPFLTNALSTRDIHRQAHFRNCGPDLIKLIRKYKDSVGLQRLYQIYRFQLQHHILLTSEKLKINLADRSSANVSVEFLVPGFEIELRDEEFNEICSSCLNIIADIVDSAIPSSAKNLAIRVFITGGMSSSYQVNAFIEKLLPQGSTIKRLSALHSIVAGLAIVARQLNLNQEISELPDNVRGVPVMS